MAAAQPSTVLRISSNGLWKGTVFDREYVKCRDGSGGAAAGQPRPRIPDMPRLLLSPVFLDEKNYETVSTKHKGERDSLPFVFTRKIRGIT
jgi:hypothetical protein